MTASSAIRTREGIRQRLSAMGFARVGFTSAANVDDGISPWVSAGKHASMEWMARHPDRRSRPESLLRDVRVVICCAAAYPASDGDGHIAAYARGEDYHRTVGDLLRSAASQLEREWPGERTRVVVDAEPLAERAFAARAGLGWIGRSSMLLNELYGPWLLLGEILFTKDLPADEPVPDRCGTCTACVDACPTGALDGEGGLDARKCLSYWTIEHRGALPATWASAIGHRAFGCDDCLAACPYPKASSLPPEAEAGPFIARTDLAAASLEELERRAHESFRRHFGSTPIERARKSGFLRNINAVAGHDVPTGHSRPPREDGDARSVHLHTRHSP